MTTQGRRGGTRTRRPAETTIERAPATEPAPTPEAQLLDDQVVPIARRGIPLGRSLTGAVAGTVLVVGLAFGAALGPGGALGPKDGGDGAGVATAQDGGHGGTDADGKGDDWGDLDATAKPAGDGEGGDEPTKQPGDAAEPTDKPDADPTAKPKPESTPKPKPESTPKPTEKPDPTKAPTESIALTLAIREYHPKLEWGTCDGLDFDYYKVVRSTNSGVAWPTGDGDELIAAVERGGYRKAYDKNSPHGVKVWYRVFCVRKGEDGYKVVNASATKGIEVPEEPAPPPPPDPITLELGFDVTDEGKVVLDWSACDVDGFAFYKVVKSTWNDEPSYYPWTDGTEVIGVVSEMFATEWQDWAPDAGHTAWYRVQCLGYAGDQKVLLGESAVVTVTTP